MGLLSVISQAHAMMTRTLRPGDIAIDATVGNGVDTLFLAQTVGPRGLVYGFDIQEEALASARKRFAHADISDANVRWTLRNHAQMLDALPEEIHGTVAGVMFNLGYLPGGDRSVITQTDSTLSALDAALRVLKPGGLVTIVLYPGHPGGDVEAEAVHHWAEQLSQAQFQSCSYRFLNQAASAPFLAAVCKR